jgi:predicted nucleic acid-binding protein
MPDLFVVDTGPLIAWDRMACLDVIGRVPGGFVCPTEVRMELDQGQNSGHPRIAPKWLRTRPCTLPPVGLATIELDAGERAVLQLALETSATCVVIDEWKGRRAALALGLAVTGSLGMLAKAKQLGLVGSVRPFIERATSQGIRYHPTVVAAVLRVVGEA